MSTVKIHRMDEIKVKIGADSQELVSALDALDSAEKREALANELLGKSYHQVAEELHRLNAERKAAAQAGDLERVKALNAQIAVHLKALRQLRQARQIDRIAMAQQAQMASRVTSSFKSLGAQITNFSEAAKEGTLNVGDMTSSVIDLAMNIRAMANPIGLAMLAVQGFMMVWSAYARQQEQIKKLHEERLKYLEDLRSARIEKNLEVIKAERAAEVESNKQRITGYSQLMQARLEEERKYRAESLAEERSLEDEKNRHRKKALEEQIAIADDARKKELQKELDAIDETNRKAEVRRAEGEARIAKQRVAAMQKELENPELQQYLKIKLPDRDEYNRLLAQIAVEENKTQANRNGLLLQELRKRKVELDAARFEMVKDVEAIDRNFMGGIDAAYDLVSGIQAGARETEKALESYRKEANAAERAAEATREKADNARQEANQTRKRITANTELDKALKRINDDTKTIGSYTYRSSKTQYEIMLSDRRLLNEKMRRLRAARAQADGIADRAKVEALDREIDNVSKSLRGVSQQLDDSIPDMVKKLREGLTPQQGAVAINPKRQQQIDEVFAKMAERGTELEKLVRQRVAAQRRAAQGDILAADELQRIDERIIKNRRILAKDAEQIDKRVVGGKAGAEYLAQMNANIKAVAKAYGEQATAQREQTAATRKATRETARKPVKDTTPAEMQGRIAELQSANGELERVNKQLRAFSRDVVDGLKGLYTSTQTIAASLSDLNAELAGVKGAIRSLNERVGKIATRNI